MRVFIRADGTVEFIYDDRLRPLLALGASSICRASHIEPDPEVPGYWIADMRPRGGPIQRGFALRSEALDWEIDWLERNSLGRRESKS